MYDKFKRQSKIWRYAAWTAPFVALAALIGLDLIGLDNTKDIISIIIIVAFIATSVFWWWWAMDKFNELIKSTMIAEKKFLEIKDYIKETKDILDEHYKSDRERRE